jgi:hypothetical protein
MRVGLVVPCYIDVFYPEVGMAALELLEKLGVEVEYPFDQTCCGQPMANSGCESDARATEELFIRNFAGFEYIVIPSGSCTHHVRNKFQNAVVRLALHGSPSTAVMTTNTAQFAVDVATLIRGREQATDVSQVRHRAYVTLTSILGFVVGLVVAAILQIHFGLWSIAFPFLLAVLSIPLGEAWNDGT